MEAINWPDGGGRRRANDGGCLAYTLFHFPLQVSLLETGAAADASAQDRRASRGLVSLSDEQGCVTASHNPSRGG